MFWEVGRSCLDGQALQLRESERHETSFRVSAKKQRRQKEEESSRRRDMDGIAVFEIRVSAQSADWVHSASEP